jgi:small ligand-binding sensory domain FIST
LIGSSTPFLNGQPYSLFLGEECLSHGIAGVAFSSKNPILASKMVSSGTFLGKKMMVTKSRGNIILEVDDKQNPTQKLLDCIKERNREVKKDEQFFLAISKDNQVVYF